jgi:hypothetical protein
MSSRRDTELPQDINNHSAYTQRVPLKTSSSSSRKSRSAPAQSSLQALRTTAGEHCNIRRREFLRFRFAGNKYIVMSPQLTVRAKSAPLKLSSSCTCYYVQWEIPA